MPPHLITATGLEYKVHDTNLGKEAAGIEISAKETFIGHTTAEAYIWS